MSVPKHLVCSEALCLFRQNVSPAGRLRCQFPWNDRPAGMSGLVCQCRLQILWPTSALWICNFSSLPAVSAEFFRSPGTRAHIRSAFFLSPLQSLTRQRRLLRISRHQSAHKICYSSSFSEHPGFSADLTTSSPNWDLLYNLTA